MSPVADSREAGGLVPNESLTARSIKDNSLCAQDVQKLAGNLQGLATLAIPQVLVATIAAGAISGTILNATAPYALRILNVSIECTGAKASGTVILRNGTDAITDAMICAVDKTIVNAGTIDNAYSTIAAGGTLSYLKNHADDNGVVTITLVRA